MNYNILVNKDHLLDKDYYEKVIFHNLVSVNTDVDVVMKTIYLEKTCAYQFELLRRALLKKRIIICVESGFRTFDKQQEIIEEFIKEIGAKETLLRVAPVGASEHHTGLAVDFMICIDGKWVEPCDSPDLDIINNLIYEFGFIVRYPLGKESVTGFNYEPWHLRYVGREIASGIRAEGVTLEEYLLKYDLFLMKKI